MTRQIVLDTETTGLNAKLGDRVIEIGCLELLNRRPTGNHFHHYLNPERASEEGALKVHGISDEFLLDKPRFREIAAEFIEYIRDAELVIHNAPFDVEFLEQELALAKLPPLAQHCAGVKDTLKLAKELHPGKKNSLDALCERYGVNNTHRTLHGALLDAELLAEVYLAMTRGQESLVMELEPEPAATDAVSGAPVERPALTVLSASPEELAEHAAVLQGIQEQSKGKCVWLALDGEPASP
ncbi:MAG: DNA polymerase III subunit epsilon [Burkholderiales bacterium]|nr:DNA polymerase III subunit epsilon [Burkholderiales bacterium]